MMGAQRYTPGGFRGWFSGTVRTSKSILDEIAAACRWGIQDARTLAMGIYAGNRGKIRIGARGLCRDGGHVFNQAALLLAFVLLRALFVFKRAGAGLWRAMKDSNHAEGGL